MDILTVDSLLTLTGLAAFVAIVVQLVKPKVADWRWTQLLAAGIGVVAALVATWIRLGLSAETVVNAVLLGVVAGVGSSGAYEGVVNLLAKLFGKGSRTDTALITKAEETLATAK